MFSFAFLDTLEANRYKPVVAAVVSERSVHEQLQIEVHK